MDTLLSFQTCEINSIQENELTNVKCNPSQPNTMDDLNSFSIKRPPFPPSIDTEYLVENLLKRKSKNPKMPNEFFIYRAALVKELKANNYKIKMTNLSTLASRSWNQEPSQVKSEYRKLARETERQYLKVRSIEMSNTINNSGKNSDRKKRISKNVALPSKPVSHDNSITALPDIVDGTMSPLPEINDDVTTIMRPTLVYQPYPSHIWSQSHYEYDMNDFMLMENNSIFTTYNENVLYLTPSQLEKNDTAVYPYIDSLSTFSSENSSPVSNSLSYPPSPLSSSSLPIIFSHRLLPQSLDWKIII
ncbi:10057_t:CDS:2 [Funneliformis caledonium]|uniref:10057_t:CDS:1 n=1 Tax=Funneliformis caledonium TaxID=1117310 RepID=A0A9N8VG65_9GLOM|nr:10057_t:CDS:2 [Funneliformis caledonium]